jgi:hypothetical protein
MKNPTATNQGRSRLAVDVSEPSFEAAIGIDDGARARSL